MHPNDTVYSRRHPLEWYQADDGYAEMKRSVRIFECVQQPGDAIVVPLNWGHAVLNIETSIGIAMEFMPFYSENPADLGI